MSNVKQIEIIGEMPAFAHENPEGQRLLAQLNGPAFGLRIIYQNSPRLVPNVEVDPNTPHRAGQTALYPFRIVGTEAVSFAAFRQMLATIRFVGGTIKSERCKDLEGRQ